jgi:hypothetical protein
MAISSIGAAFLLILVPGPFLRLFAIDSPVLGPVLGFVFLALGGTLWGAREAVSTEARRAVALGNAVCDAGVTLVMVVATLAGTLPTGGWILALVFAVNAVTWGLTERVGTEPAAG